MTFEHGDRVEVVTVDDSNYGAALIGRRGTVVRVSAAFPANAAWPVFVDLEGPDGTQGLTFGKHELRKLSLLEVLAESSR